mmetsp:Transcript_38545/g.97025  ORF Transcript_38545/g.97025 Transcript_38545/m.97025 type:complete len:238 (+) Transcript_38545:927-1640(+)
MQVEALAMAVVTLTTTQQLLLHLANEVQLGVLTDVDGDRKLVHDRRQQEEEQRDGDRDRDTGVVHLHGDAAGPGAHHQSDDHRLHEQHQLDEPQEEQRGVEPEERVMCVLVTAPAAETRALLAAVLAAVLTAGRQTAAQQRHNGADPAQIERFKVTTQNLVFVASAVMVMVMMVTMLRLRSQRRWRGVAGRRDREDGVEETAGRGEIVWYALVVYTLHDAVLRAIRCALRCAVHGAV